MPGAEPGPGGLPIERADLVTRDMDVITDLLSRLYAQHRARTRRIPEATPDAATQAAVAGSLQAGLVRIDGVEYETDAADTDGRPMGLVAIEGRGEMTVGREQHRFTRGEVFLALPDRPFACRMHGLAASLLQIPWSVAGQVAEAHTGLPAADLRFTSMAPVSPTAAAMWARTVAFGCQQLIDSRLTEISPLVAQEMTHLTAAAMLETFPNTAMTLGYIRGTGWVPPAAVRRAVAFIDANPEQPITLDDIAAAAGVSGRALQYAFRRHYGTAPTGYLRRVRLERAHAELRDAIRGDGVTVAAVARRWGWSNPAHFAAAYQRQHGQLPALTLRAASG
jgi:AraC-like DNA-binding protein